MEALFNWNYFVALLFLLYAGGEVRCDCTEENIKINGGHYTLTKHLDKDSWLVYHCPEGYYPYPHFRHSCQPGGNWEPAPSSHQKCKLVQCPDPTVLQDGFITPQLDTYFVTNVTTFECRAGFTMRGSSSRTCLPNGKWSGDTTICSRDSMSACADPGVPPGASRTGNTFEIGNKVKYACNEDLFLVGSSERVCQENGYWTGKEPACYYKYTYDTARDVSENFGRKIKDILTMPQPEDVKQEGKTIRIAKNGTLNIYIGLDVSPGINEDHIKGGIEAIKTFIQKVSSFSVSPNYEIFFFTSEIHEVVNIMDFMDSQHNSPASVISKLESFKLPKTTGTNINLAFRTVEERMAIIKVRVGQENFKEHRHVIILLTDGAYNMGGNPLPTVARIKRMAYMGQTDGSRDEYLDIYVFAIGIDIFDDDLQPLTAGTGGQHYFRLRDVTNLQETFDEIIDESDVIGLCGLHKDYETTGDKISKRKRYPWLAFVIILGASPKRCIGSLVAPQFVLTAAHCFQFGDLPEHVTVEIEDRAGSIVKKVKTFYIHPNYNINAKQNQGVDKFFDYDVALIQLKEPLQISTIARPICIPCTQETNNALQLASTATCEEQEQLLLRNQRERLSFLTRADPLVQEKDVFAKLGDHRNDCIKKALQANGIVTNDPTVAVTENFLCTGGIDHYREHIACLSDAGGAVFKDYKLRTIQIGLVSWGTQPMCATGGLFESSEDSRDFHINLFRMVPFLKSILGKDDQDDYEPLKFLS